MNCRAYPAIVSTNFGKQALAKSSMANNKKQFPVSGAWLFDPIRWDARLSSADDTRHKLNRHWKITAMRRA